jgi:hypothetical protein
MYRGENFASGTEISPALLQMMGWYTMRLGKQVQGRLARFLDSAPKYVKTLGCPLLNEETRAASERVFS